MASENISAMKNITLTSVVNACVMLCVITSCEKELDFKYHEVSPQLVIEGAITQHGTSVTVTQTTPMGEPMNTTPITDASVVISDLATGQSHELLPDQSSCFTDSNGGIPGHEYRLEVTRHGKTYVASSIMREQAELLSLDFQWIKMPYDHVAVLQVSFTDRPAQGDCYWIRLTRNGEAYKWWVLEDNHSVDGVINSVIMTSRKDTDEEDDNTVLRDGDVVGVSVVSVSREMFDYLTALQADSNGPAMFQGDFCLGYFLAGAIAESSIVFKPDEMTEFN